MKCPRCNVTLIEGIVLAVDIEDDRRYCFSYPPSKGDVMPALKCPQCGHTEEYNESEI